MVNEITEIKIDIEAYQRTLNTYIIPVLAHDLLFRNPWI